MVDSKTERVILGSAMVDQHNATIVSSLLRKHYFSDSRNGIVFNTIHSGIMNGNATSPEWVLGKLKASGNLSSIGGEEYLAKIISHASGADMEPMCDIIKESYLNRRILEIQNEYDHKLKASNNRLALWNQMRIDVDTVIREVESDDNRDEYSIFQELYKDSIENKESGRELMGLDTGFVQANKMLDGFQSRLYLIIARPSMGKTAFLIHLKRHFNKIEAPAAFFSMETTSKSIAAREAASYLGVSISDLRKGRMEKEVFWKYQEYVERKKLMASIIDDKSPMTVEKFRGKIRRLKSEIGLNVVMADYAQLFKVEKRLSVKDNKYDYIAEYLRRTAEEEDVSIIALAQAKREVETRNYKAPQMGDTALSDAFEREAWALSSLYRPSKYGISKIKSPDGAEKYYPYGYTEWNILKNKEGPTGVVRLKFVEESMEFKEDTGEEIPLVMDELPETLPSEEVPF